MANMLCRKHHTECFCGAPVDPNYNTVCPSCKAKISWHSDTRYCLYCQSGAPTVKRPEAVVMITAEANPLVSGIINLFQQYLPLGSEEQLPKKDCSRFKFYCYLEEHPLWEALFKVAIRLGSEHSDTRSALLRTVFEMAMAQTKLPMVPGMYNGRTALFTLTREQADEAIKELAAEQLLSALKEILHDDKG